MIEDETHMVQRAKAERSRCWLGGLALAAVGAAGLIGGSGFALLTGAEGDRATVAGVAAGMGLAFMLLGGLMAWWVGPVGPSTSPLVATAPAAKSCNASGRDSWCCSRWCC